MSNDTEPMAYIARRTCGCFTLASVITEGNQRDIGDEIKICLEAGDTIDRVSVAFVRANWRVECPACKEPEQLALAIDAGAPAPAAADGG